MSNAKCPAPAIPLPQTWPESVKSAMLHVISLAQFAAARTRGWAANSINARVRLKAEKDRLQQNVELLREEIRIKDARLKQIPATRRPHYPPCARMAILELKSARSWSLEQTAKTFLVTAATIASWLKRIDETGPAALLQLPQPVNKFPEFVSHAVRRLKTLCPAMGKVKIAQMLARAGLHLGTTTVGRMLKGGENAAKLPPAVGDDRQPDAGTKPVPAAGSETPANESAEVGKGRVVTAKYPNHLWHADLTVVPTALGFWTSWMPFALPQNWPFCWWVAVVIDHFSRRVMGVAGFKQQPTSEAVRGFLGRAVRTAGAAPKYVVTDKGVQFWNAGFKAWCKRKRIQPRFGAIGQHGGIAVVERFILGLKDGCTRLLLVPYRRENLMRELNFFRDWYNDTRPHTTLGGRTPNEVYEGKRPASQGPRFEPRAGWPRGSPCAEPQTLIKGQPGVRLNLQVTFYKGRKHLPLIALTRAA